MKISVLLSLIPLASALPGVRQSPTKSPNGAFGVTAARSASPIHFLPLTASGSHFWLGGETQTYFPDAVPNCYQQNSTILYGEHYLDVLVPGGQAIYVDPNGALSFTIPHSGYMPPGSSQGPFTYTPGQPLGTWTYTGQGASGFMACPVPRAQTQTTAVSRRADSAPRWQVFAARKNVTVPTGSVRDCLGFEALALAVNVSSSHLAWEYI